MHMGKERAMSGESSAYPPGMRLGIGSFAFAWAIGVPGYPVTNPMSACDLVERAAALGVKVVQIGDNLPLQRLTDDELRGLAARADEAGIALEVGTRGIAAENLRRYLAIASRLGSPILRVVIDSGTHHPSVDEVVATVRPLLADFAAAGVTLAIENHDRFPAAVLVRLLEQLDSPWVGICLDTVNNFGALEGPDVVIRSLGPYTVNLHVKDFVVQRATHQMGFTVAGAPSGAGMLDVPRLLRDLAGLGARGNAIIELWTPPQADIAATVAQEAAWAAQSVQAMRRWLPE